MTALNDSTNLTLWHLAGPIWRKCRVFLVLVPKYLLDLINQWIVAHFSLDENGLLIAIPIGTVLLYVGSTALRLKRKWKYSYLA